MKPGGVFFYCQHLLGLGHWRRGLTLARALSESGLPVLFVTGGLPPPALELGGAESLALPPLTAADDTAGALALPDGQPPDSGYLAARAARLLDALRACDPAVVLLELFPFGRHALAFELAPLLIALEEDRRRRGPAAPRLVVSLRDILVSKRNQPWYELTTLAVTRQWVDLVLVHGCRSLIPLSDTFRLAERLGRRLVYTGYVAPSTCDADRRATAEVLVSGGGGRVAGPLLRAALAARALCPAARARPWRLLTGPYLPSAAREELEAHIAAIPTGDGPGVVLETFREDFPSRLRRAALSISQAGYNTVVDVLASNVRAVLVPYGGSGDEQPLRAALLAQRGLARVVPEAELSPERLAATMAEALASPAPPGARTLDLGGAARSAELVGALVERVRAAREGRVAAPRPRGGGRRGSGVRARPAPARPRPRGPTRGPR